MTRIYLSQKMSYPVTDDIRMHVTKNIFVADSANIFVTKNLSYVANYGRVTKNILCDGWREYICHKNVLSCGRRYKNARHEKYFRGR